MTKRIENLMLLQEQTKVQKEFSSVDYYVFGGMLGISVLIGIYFGCFGSKQNSRNEYLVGGGKMKVVPTAISMVATYISGIALLSVPADIYKYGSNYVWICNSIILSCVVCSEIFMPVFHKLQLISSYEYLKMRFDARVRSLASFLYTLSVLLASPVLIYIPALAFSQATGADVYVVTVIVCGVCIFYTTIGGVKAVIWTDALQAVAMAGSMLVVLFLGITSVGGFWNIIDTARNGERLYLDFNIDPTVRDSFWTYTLGTTFVWFSCLSVSQISVQRLLAVPTINDARKVLALSCVGIVFVKVISVFTGLIIFAKYFECDPLRSKQITRVDQLLPYYVVDVAGHIPGLSGLFISGIFAASLSTLSGCLNALAATFHDDFILPLMGKSMTEKRTNLVLKIVVIATGIVSTALVFVVEHLGGLLPLVISIQSITGGALLGLFSLGMLCPIANTRGALFGGITGLLFASCLVCGNLWYQNRGFYVDPIKPLSVEGCNPPINITLTKTDLSDDRPFYLFRVSFWYYTAMSTVVTIVTGFLVSWFSREDCKPVNPDLLSPIVHFVVNKRRSTTVLENEYLSDDKAMPLIAGTLKQ